MVFELHVVSQNKNRILLVREGMRVLVCQAAVAPSSHEHTELGGNPSLPPAEYSARSRAGRGLAWPHPVGSILGKSASRGSGRRVVLEPTGPLLSVAEGGTSLRQTRTRAHTPAPGQRKQTQQRYLLHAPNRRATWGCAYGRHVQRIGEPSEGPWPQGWGLGGQGDLPGRALPRVTLQLLTQIGTCLRQRGY